MYAGNFIFTVIVLCSCGVDGYRILGIFPHTAKSHDYVFYPLLRGLAQKGHDVTVISHFPYADHPKSYRHINMRGSVPILDEAFAFDTFQTSPLPFGVEKVTMLVKTLMALTGHANSSCHALLANKEVQNLKEEQFDLAIIETFNSDCGLGLIDHLKLPFIGFSSHTLMPWTKESLGLSGNPSYLPTQFLGYGTNPTFFQTIKSFFVRTIAKAVYHKLTKDQYVTLERHYGRGFENFQEKFKDMNFNLVSTYFPLHGTFEYPPNVIEVGGIHINNFKPLPKDLQQYMDESKDGVILFSMGSMLRATSWSSEKLKEFQEAFSTLPQNILWKWENDTMSEAPANVKIVKWLPQLDILNHPNTRAFITHAGGLSISEAAHCGVPVLAIPILGDQFNNAAAAEDVKLGQVLDYHEITTKNILRNLRKVLDPKIKENAKRLSAIWRDRQNSPLDTGIYWVEHVVRHGGQHLRPVSANLPIYRYLLLDVLAFFTLLGIILTFTIYRLCCKRNVKWSENDKLKKC